ncbi:MAG TPA: lysophospholipid acyltransferase family protein [Pyrinomonadaceae bacterium]|jgi:1-acyl-sn-glycerol-3-phosphate acyltransferase
MSLIQTEQPPKEVKAQPSEALPEAAGYPTAEELGVLGLMERAAFLVAYRMNRGRWKRFWTLCQRTLGAGWIHLCTYNIMRVYGLEHLEAVSRERPVLLVANHRSFFDMYAVSSVLFRRTRWRKQLFFPVRGRFFYESPLGMLVNFLMGWWSMYPPIFTTTEKRLFDRYSIRLLAELCRNGAGNVIGFHPEGHRNLNDDPYSYLRPQPGIGKLIKDAAPQVVPVFIAGLCNNLPRQVLNNWRGRQPIRIHFGAQLDLSPFLERRDHVRTYKEIADFVMTKIAELGEQDREMIRQGEKGKGERGRG